MWGAEGVAPEAPSDLKALSDLVTKLDGTRKANGLVPFSTVVYGALMNPFVRRKTPCEIVRRYNRGIAWMRWSRWSNAS